jgi:hypothetical protein
MMAAVTSQGAGDLVGERAAGALDHRTAVRQRDDESAVQADPVGITGVLGVPQDLAGVVQDRVPDLPLTIEGLPSAWETPRAGRPLLARWRRLAANA